VKDNIDGIKITNGYAESIKDKILKVIPEADDIKE